MKSISATELRKNLSYYLKLCASEDIEVTNNGAVVAVLSSPDKNYYRSLAKLNGCLKEYDTGENYDDIIGEEIMRKCGFNG